MEIQIQKQPEETVHAPFQNSKSHLDASNPANLQTVTAVCVYMTEGQRTYMFFFHILSRRSLAACLNMFFEHMHLFILRHDVIYFNTSNKYFSH